MEGKNFVIAAVIAVVFGVGGFIGGRFSAGEEKKVTPVQQPENGNDFKEKRAGGKYHFINPLWECDNFNPSRMNSLVHLRENLNAYIKQTLDAKTASHISVYFRDLNSGPWMGINERDNFSPASLLKVPILIAVLKKCERERDFIKREIKFSQVSNDNVNPNIVDSHLIKIGETYTVEDLLFRMIAYSDNQAKEMLIKEIGDEQYLAEVFSDIGINLTGVNANDDFVSVKDYSSFFRLLYNATYLNKEMSEKALEILSKTKYEKGIVAGIPKGLVVAHKFGERGFENSNLKQLHDCGIVYRPGAPYLLCVMTRGDDFEKLAGVIAGVSEIVHRDIQAAASN